ncbi:MAG: hypothetical protein IJL67_09040 [Oscillospiraceae bacterium]|nr:hypothetical protein [Oscillospiraceae bacterium]
MSKEYESIMIIGGEAAEKIISGEVKCMIMHRVSADGFSENTFVRNTPVIQCISPSCQNGESKVKFSVKADFNGRLFPEISRLIFSEKLDLVYEIRCGSETVASGNINACGFEIVPSDNEENPELRFIEEYISGNEVTDEHIEINGINDELNALQTENASLLPEVDELRSKLFKEQEKNRELLEEKENTVSKINELKEENEELEAKITEMSGLENKRDTLKKNFEELSENEKSVHELETELKVFAEILEHYRNEEGFETIKQKLDSLKKTADEITDDIAALAEKRAGDLM